MNRLRWFVILIALGLSACASLPLKQRAVVSLQASETALEASHNAERTLCSPTADPTKAITHCDGSTAAVIGLTDAVHQDLARKFAAAFDVQIVAATAVQTWRAGEPPPKSVADYHRDLTDLLAVIKTSVPKSGTVVDKAQESLDKAAAVAAIFGVQ